MKALIFDETNKQKVEKLLEFANRPENYYVIGTTSFIPGDRPEYVAQINDYRCVFTMTKDEGLIYRHLSISVPVPGRLPHPIAAFTMATWFGFTGAIMNKDVAMEPGKDWQIGLGGDKGCVVFLQALLN